MTWPQRLSTAVVVCLLVLGGGPLQLWQLDSLSRPVRAATDSPLPPIPSSSGPLAEQSNTTISVPPGLPAASEPREVVELRTSHSKTFLNPDDQTYIAQIWNAPIHYRDSQGRWQDTDNRLVASPSPGYLVENAANAFKARFGSVGRQDMVRFEAGDKWVTLTPTGSLRAQTPAIADNRITYHGLFDGIDLQYEVTSSGIKENIILAAPPRQNRFAFLVRVGDGVRLESQVDNSILFRDAAGNDLWRVPVPIMFDRAPGPDGRAPVGMELTAERPGVYRLTLTASDAWLADPARVYPVTIDPAITINIQPSATDTEITSGGFADSNWGGYGDMGVGYSTSGGWKARSLVQFDLSAIPPQSTILEATLALYVLSQVNPTPHTSTVHQVTRGWTEMGATWNRYDGVNTWSAAGSDHSAMPEATASFGTVAAGTPIRWFTTNLVQRWLSGATPNYGFLVKSQNENLNTVDYYHTRQSSNSTFRPVLSVRYAPWLGQQADWQYDAGVNVANGNLILRETDLSMSGVGLSNAVARTYNSLSPWSYAFGRAWQPSIGQHVTLSLLGDGSYMWTEFSGTVVRFAKNSDGSFASPPGTHHSLEVVGDAYKLTDRDGTTYTFGDSTLLPRLLSVKTRDNNTLSYGYDGSGRVASITDTVGRTTSLTYNPQSYIATLTDNASRSVQYGYDANGYLTSVTDQGGYVTTYGYNANGRLNLVRDPRSNTVQYGYDANGRVSSITNQLGKLTTFTYNSGNTVVTDAYNHGTTYTYDAYGRVTLVRDARGGTRQYEYDADHNVTRTTDRAGKVTTFSYDSLYRLTSATDPVNLTATASYGDANTPYQPTAVTDPRNKQTTYAYSLTGNLTSAQAPSLPAATFT